MMNNSNNITTSSSRRTNQNNDSMSSMDQISELGIADKSSKFRRAAAAAQQRVDSHVGSNAVVRQNKSQTSQNNQTPFRRRARNQFRADVATRQDQNPSAVSISTSSSTRSCSTPRSSMEDDLVRLHPERFGNNNPTHQIQHHQQRQRQKATQHQRQKQQKHKQKHRPEVPTLESLLLHQPEQPPANANAKVQTEHIRKHRNTEVVLGNTYHTSPSTSSSGRKKKQSVLPIKKYHRKPRSSPMKSKLKMLNCFTGSSSSSGKPKIGDNDDDEARRQLAAIEEYYGEIIVPKGDEYNCYDEDNYGEANSLAASMSVVTMGSNEQSPNNNSNNNNNGIRRNHSNSPKEILKELQDDEESLNSGYERRETSENRDVITPLKEKKKDQSPKQSKNPSRQQQPYNQQKLQQQRISVTTSVIQGVVTPPRGAVSTSWMKGRQQVVSKRGLYNNCNDEQSSIAYHSVATGSTTAAGAASSQTTTSVVNLASEQQQQKQLQQHAKTMKIGPRCHLCGGGHWIYNCPHMNDSSEGRNQHRAGARSSSSNYRNREDENDDNDDDYYAADVSGSVTRGGLNDSFTTTDTTTTESSSIACGGGNNQSNPFQCRVCFRR
jgi:hypothetical protein